MFVYLSISQSVNRFVSVCMFDSMSFELTRLRAIGLVILRIASDEILFLFIDIHKKETRRFSFSEIGDSSHDFVRMDMSR